MQQLLPTLLVRSVNRSCSGHNYIRRTRLVNCSGGSKGRQGALVPQFETAPPNLNFTLEIKSTLLLYCEMNKHTKLYI